MATKTFCDRCGQEIWARQALTRLRITYHSNEIETFELCPDCVAGLKEYLDDSTGA